MLDMGEDIYLDESVLVIDSIIDRLFCDNNLSSDDELITIKESIDNIKSEG